MKKIVTMVGKLPWYKKIPTGMAVIYNLFWALFALDVFGEGLNVVEMIVGLVMHLVPNMVLLAVTVVAHKKPLAGSVMFGGLFVVFTFFFHAYREPMVLLLIAGPLLVIAGLYGVGWRQERRKS